MLAIAQALGVNRCTLRERITAGLEPDDSELEAALAAAIQRGRAEGEERLLQRLHTMAEKGDTRAATSAWGGSRSRKPSGSKSGGIFMRVLYAKSSRGEAPLRT
jgi:hypothetical protein